MFLSLNWISYHSKLRSAEFKTNQNYNKFKASKGKPSVAVMKKNEFASNSHSDRLLNAISGSF